MSLTPPGPPLPPLPSATPPPPRRSGVLLSVLVVVVALALIGTGVAVWKLVDDGEVVTGGPTPTPSRSAAPMPTTDRALARFYDQDLTWKKCGPNRCARMRVPLDYAAPGGPEIRIAVLKVPADDQKDKVGALVVNPGGPGGSGTEFAAYGSSQFGSRLTRYFDIVGFDPRGVGDSDPLECLGEAGLDKVLAFDPDPDDATERTELDTLIKGFGQGCLDRSGELARHISTVEAAKDMDVLRAVLDQPRLDYLGSSYGTFLGATYAEEFPTHVGRFVLDGAIDPSLSNEDLALEQGRGFETALRAYVKDCIGKGGCFLGRTVDAGTQKIREFLDDLDSEPLPTGEDRKLTEGLGMLGIWMPLYAKEYWSYLTDALRAAMQNGDGSGLLGLADTYASRTKDGYSDNSMSVLYAVNCLDHSDSIPVDQVPQYFAKFEKASPTFGRSFAFSLSTCTSWPVKSGQRTVALHAKGAPPIVVVGTTRDPATPLVWAQALAEQLDSGRLITRDGDGHTGFKRGSACVDQAVEKWLIAGTAPKPDLRCS